MTANTTRRFIAIIAFAAACGGSAVIDADNEDAGVGGAGSATSNVTVGPVVGAVGVGGPVDETLCFDACNSLAACASDTSSCIDNCENRDAGACGALHNQWISCSLGETGSMCGFGPSEICEPELSSYLACTNEVVGDQECEISPDGCACQVFISPGTFVEQRCDADGCDCFLGDGVFATCEPPDATCDIVAGCCAGALFTGGLF